MKSAHLLLLSFVITLCFVLDANAKTIVTYSLRSSTSKDLERWIDSNTVVFITLDQVLVRPDYKMFGFNANPYRNFADNIIANAKNSQKWMEKAKDWYNQRKLALVEAEWKDFIDRAKAKGALVFGVCDTQLKFDNMEQRTLLELAVLGIKFTPSITGHERLALEKSGSFLSVFHHGIIFSGPFSTARAMENLMKVSMHVPKKIVYFDVIPDAIRRVDKVLRPLNTDFYTVIYNGIKRYTPVIKPKEIEFQQSYFLKTGILLRDEDVQVQMQNEVQESECH